MSMTKHETANIGQQVRDRRLKAKLSAAALAERIGVSRAFVRKIESGLKTPSVARLIQIANALECSPCDLTVKGGE